MLFCKLSESLFRLRPRNQGLLDAISMQRLPGNVEGPKRRYIIRRKRRGVVLNRRHYQAEMLEHVTEFQEYVLSLWEYLLPLKVG